MGVEGIGRLGHESILPLAPRIGPQAKRRSDGSDSIRPLPEGALEERRRSGQQLQKDVAEFVAYRSDAEVAR
jgi:hypothetical protein